MLKSFVKNRLSPDRKVERAVRAIADEKKRFKLFRAYRLYNKYGVLVRPNAKIGANLTVGHYPGIIIGDGTRIGDDCLIYQGVTIGQNRGCYPVIGDRCVIYANAVIVGHVRVGDDVVVGANSVVVHDVPDKAIVAGCPARIIRYQTEEETLSWRHDD